MTKLMYKKKTTFDFARKPFGNKSKFLHLARTEMMKELAIEQNMLKSDLTKE